MTNFAHDITFDQIQDVITRANTVLNSSPFIMMEREDYYVARYLFTYNGMFDILGPEDKKLLIECRGIMFNKNKHLISRPYHKFFNVYEYPETHLDKLDFTE